MEDIFTNIYEKAVWGDNKNPRYNGSSGWGSNIQNNINNYIPFLKKFIKENNIKSVVDLGCGDFICGSLIYDDLDVLYTGYDAYEKVINYNNSTYSKPKYNFLNLDFCNKKEEIINADICILKDVIQHWSLQNIYKFLDYLIESKKFKYILIINCCDQHSDNTDIPDGEFRPLNKDFLPLKKYNPYELYRFANKQVLMIN